MRGLTSEAAAALQQSRVPIVLLIEMMLSTPLRLATGGWTLRWPEYSLDLRFQSQQYQLSDEQDITYTAVGALGSVEPTTEASGSPGGLKFSLSGVPSAMVSLALSEPVQGRACNVYVAILDPATYRIVDAVLEWSGTLDTMTISEEGGSAVLTVSAEHAGIDLLRAVPVRYTDLDQQRLFPGDRGFEFVTDQADQTIVWPAASFFRQ
jgi:hypothetical protein